MKVLNLTQHRATPEQVAEGVFEPKDKALIQELLTFFELPSPYAIQKRVDHLVRIAKNEGAKFVMIGGAPFMMNQLHVSLELNGINVLYSFSKRVSKEVERDGRVEKVSVFEHTGFVRFDECEECKIGG